MSTLMEKWNWIEIKEPPYFTQEYICEEQDDIDLGECVKLLSKRFGDLDELLNTETIRRYFLAEVKILGVLLKINKRLGAHKFFGHLKKICKCVEHLKALKLHVYVTKLNAMMPNKSSKYWSVHLPTKMMFEYLLAKIMGSFKLLLAIETNCREASRFLLVDIHIARVLKLLIPLLAIAARIRAMSVDIAAQLASIYDDILPWLQQLTGGIESKFIDGHSTCLMDELKNHCKVPEDETKSKLIRETTSSNDESSILDIFGDKAENSPALLNGDSSDKEMKSNVQENSAEGQDEAITAAEGSVVSVAKKRKRSIGDGKVKKHRKLKEKEDVLSLLDILDDAGQSVEYVGGDAINGVNISRKGSEVSSDTLPDSSVVADSILLCEDLGEAVRN